MGEVAESIRRGLEEAVAYARGEAKESDYRVHVPALIDARTALREAEPRARPNSRQV
jgi:hypothetical protein